MSVCSYCCKEGRLAAHGLCPICYARYRRNGTAEPVQRAQAVEKCAYCYSADGPFIKKLCRACYQQQYKTGSPERTRVRQLCEQPGCDEHVHAKGFCQKHHMRIRRTGSPDAREDGRGSRGKHPLYERWKSMNRGARGGVVPEWKDFWNFVADVGERPTPTSRLCRISESELYGPHNVEWREVMGHYTAENRVAKNAYMKAFRAARPTSTKRAMLKRFYGVTLEWYEDRLREQNSVCAICQQPEINRHHKTGEVMMLAVDHDHGTGATRSLLCHACNTGIGSFKDSPTLLRAAADYLDRHNGTGWFLEIDEPLEPVDILAAFPGSGYQSSGT